MLYDDLPADELCAHACSTYLNIHITIHFHHGSWSMLALSNTNHDLLILLSGIHLVYRGYCWYNLLSKNSELGTKGRSLLLQNVSDKNVHTNLPEAKIELRRVEEWNILAKKLLLNKLVQPEIATSKDTANTTSDSENTDIYEIHENIISTITYPGATKLENVSSMNHRLRRPKAALKVYLPFKCPHSSCTV